MTLAVGTDSTVKVEGREFPTNGGGLCHKGWTSAELLRSPHRLTSPIFADRPNGPSSLIDWESAMDQVALRIKGIQSRYGPDSVAIFGGGGLTNEKAYSLGKFARVVLETSRIDYNGRFCMSSAAAASNRSLGMDRGMPFPITDLAETEVVLLVGGNVAETMPPFVRHLTAAQDNGGKLVVIDPRRTATARIADIHLQPIPGTDIAVALGLLHLIIAHGLVDTEYVEARTVGFDEVRSRVTAFWPEQVERITGVPVSELRKVASLLGHARRSVIMTARGPEQQSKGVDTVTAFINLALALGLPGRPSSGYATLTGQGNGQGGREHGQKNDQLPGYRSISDPVAREHVAAVWGVSAQSLPGAGTSAYELLDSLGTVDGPKAMLVFGSNPVVSAPHAEHIEERLAALELLVVADPFLSETGAIADFVFPVTQFAEEDGTMTNLEGRVIRRRKAIDPPTGVRSDLDLLSGLADRLGKPGIIRTKSDEVFAELGRASAGGIADYSGMSYSALDAGEGAFWPWGSGSPADTPRIFVDKFPTKDGRARFIDVVNRPIAEPLDDEFPVYLTTGRILSQYQSGTQTRLVQELVDIEPSPFVEMHPGLAERHDLSDGDSVRIISRRGEVIGAARVTNSIRLDTIFMPFHWSGSGRVNAVTNPALDSISGMPEFKVCAVRLERVVVPIGGES